MQYRVRLFDSSAAAIREQLIVAPSKEAASQGFEASGLVVLSVQVAARPRWAPVLDHAASLDVPWWCKELRTLLAAGMTVVEALETLNEEAVGSARARVHATVVGCLREGQPLSAAMQAAAVFPGVLVAGVKASERTSALVDALDDYLRYHEMLDRLRKQIVSAAIYPAVVVALGGMITLFLLLFVIPRFSGMYADLRGPVSWTTAWLVTTSRLLNAHWNVVAGGFASVLALLIGA
ncbi:MAG TPA: type II secretion system F family protein, partial [Burkholderiaceae bacterium]|nr:type II secretion system F family protein [Burkholderiaceae bacterium]